MNFVQISNAEQYNIEESKKVVPLLQQRYYRREGEWTERVDMVK